MRPADCEGEMLGRLAWTPLLDRLEMVCVSGWSRAAVYEAVRRLEEGGFAASIPHAAELTPPTRRYFLTPGGLRRLAGDENAAPVSSPVLDSDRGTEQAVDKLLRSRPVSAQWRRILMERLDALAVIYRLASNVANAAARPVRLRLYRAGPLDAAVMLPGGRTVGIVRQGLTADRSAFSKRLWRLGEGPLPGAVLVLASDEVRLRHSRRALARTSAPAVLALERDAVLAGADDPVWRPTSGNAALDLGRELGRMRPGGELPWERPLSRATVPGDVAPDADHALPAILKPAEKRALDLLADWPWILQRDMAGLMGISETRASRLTNPLEAFGLVARPVEGTGRLALTDRGLAMVARRDRASVGVARRRWSVAPIDPEGPYDWRNVSGGRSRQLNKAVNEAVKDTGEVLKAAAPPVLDEQIQTTPDGQPPPPSLPHAQESWKEEFELEINWARWKVTVEVTNDPGVSEWIRVFDTGADGDVRQLGVSLSLSHPFMERFVGTDFDRIKPFVRLAAAIGLAEITARESGARLTGEMRRNINQLLKDALSSS